MNDFLSLPRTLRIQDTGVNAPSYLAGVIQSQPTRRAATKERAQQLYAIGELNAAAQMLCELAARRHPFQAEGRGEAING